MRDWLFPGSEWAVNGNATTYLFAASERGPLLIISPITVLQMSQHGRKLVPQAPSWLFIPSAS